jgi:hypothetical protein
MRTTIAETSLRKTFKYKLIPTPVQEWELERVLRLCRTLYNTALEQRITAWQRCHVSVSRYEQEAELKAIRAEMPDYAAVHSHVLQDVLARLEKTSQAYFRRMQRGEGGKKAGFPRFKGRDRFHSFTYKELGNGARLDNGFLVLSKIGRLAVRWSRSLEGTAKTVTVSREADGWYVSFSCAEVPVQPLPPTGQETGIDLGLESFATRSDGTMLHNPRCYRKAERYLARCQRRLPPEEGEPSPAQSRDAAGQGAPDGAAPAPGLPPQGGAPLGAPVRHDLSRSVAAGQHAQESSSGKVHRGRRVERVLEHPVFQSGRGWEDSRSGAACLYLASLFGLRRACRQGLVGPLA